MLISLPHLPISGLCLFLAPLFIAFRKNLQAIASSLVLFQTFYLLGSVSNLNVEKDLR